jgi:hypothetical protein
MTKQLVLLGEGHGENDALPSLIRRILRETSGTDYLLPQSPALRTKHPVRWNAETGTPDFSEWQRRVELAARKSRGGAVLAVFDGDFNNYPPGSSSSFCAAAAAKMLAFEAAKAGAGKTCSLAVVFACVEYESWLVAGVESLAGKRLPDGRAGMPAGIAFPSGHPESHGKGWLEKVWPTYKPALHQKELTELLDLSVVRAKGLRSFQRLDNAVDQLIRAAERDTFICTPG